MEPHLELTDSPSSLQAPARSVAGLAGYMLSSMELHAGLDVRAIPASKLPLETLRELLRMQASWPKTPVPVHFRRP